MKKFFAIIMIVLSLALMQVSVFAAEGTYTEGTLYYTVDNESITITGCFGKDETVEVPSQIAGYPVNTIAAGAFTGNSYIKSVILPDTITTIQEGAFDIGITVTQEQGSSTPTSDGTPDSNSETKNTDTSNEGSSKSTTHTTEQNDTELDDTELNDTGKSAAGNSTVVIQAGNAGDTNADAAASGASSTKNEPSAQGSFEEQDIYLDEEDLPDSSVTGTDDELSAAEEEPEQSANEKYTTPIIVIAIVVVVGITVIILIKKTNAFERFKNIHSDGEKQE